MLSAPHATKHLLHRDETLRSRRARSLRVTGFKHGGPMHQNRKYFGMTGLQIGILVALAGALFLILCVAGWVIFGNGFSFSRLPQDIPTPVPSPTLVVIPTITTTPLPTLVPYEQLIPKGWKQFRTALIEIWLPSEFKDAKLVVPKGVTTLAVPELILSKPASKTSLYNMWVVVSYEPLTTESLDSFLDLKFQSISSDLRVVERRKALVNSTEAFRIVIETRVNNVDANELAYIFQDGGTVWYVLFIAQINEFYDELNSFEDSVLTFRWVK